MNILTAIQSVAPQRCYWYLGYALALASPLVSAQEPRVLDESFLETLRAEVRTNHPSVAAAQARAEAASAAIRAVRLWEDPTAGLSARAAEVERRRDDGDVRFMAEQALPRRKLNGARKEKAKAGYAVTQAQTHAAVLGLETLVVQAAIELALADEALLIESNQVAWLESMAVNAREKLKDPQATAAGPLRIEGELAQERQRLDAATRRRHGLSRQLNTLLGRPLESAWATLSLPAAPMGTPTLDDEMSRLPVVNPMLQALAGAATAAKAEIEVTRRERKPVLSVGAESWAYSGGGFVETVVGAKMTIPWGNRSVYQANIDRARQEETAAERDAEALERRLRGEAIAAHTEAENAARQAVAFSGAVIPRFEEAAQATESAWISAKATLLEVFEARRALLNARLEQRRFVAAHRAALETLRSIIPPQTQP